MSILQPINQTVSAVASTTGTASFAFPHVPTSQIWIGTVSVPSAPDTANFVAASAGTQYGSFKGANAIGPIQIVAGETLTISASGLIPGDTYVAVMGGYVTTEGSVQPIYPLPYADTVTSTTEDIYLGTATGTNISLPITTSPSWRSIWVAAAWNVGTTSIAVTGDQSGFSYAYFQPPYFSGKGQVFYRFPMVPGLDSSVTLTASDTAGATIWYGADLADIDSFVYQQSTNFASVTLEPSTAATITTITPNVSDQATFSAYGVAGEHIASLTFTASNNFNLYTMTVTGTTTSTTYFNQSFGNGTFTVTFEINTSADTSYVIQNTNNTGQVMTGVSMSILPYYLIQPGTNAATMTIYYSVTTTQTGPAPLYDATGTQIASLALSTAGHFNTTVSLQNTTPSFGYYVDYLNAGTDYSITSVTWSS